MRALKVFCALGLVLIALTSLQLTSPVLAQSEGTVTVTIDVPDVTETPTNTPTVDPCFQPVGEEIDPCATATIDPCLIPSGEETDPCVPPTHDPCSFEVSGEEIDPCVTPSPTDEAPVQPTLTPTLEYEIDEPISFFPTDTVVPENEETVAAVETEDVRDDVVTELPNTGGGSTSGPSYGLLVVFALVALLGSAVFAARSRVRG